MKYRVPVEIPVYAYTGRGLLAAYIAETEFDELIGSAASNKPKLEKILSCSCRLLVEEPKRKHSERANIITILIRKTEDYDGRYARCSRVFHNACSHAGVEP